MILMRATSSRFLASSVIIHYATSTSLRHISRYVSGVLTLYSSFAAYEELDCKVLIVAMEK